MPIFVTKSISPDSGEYNNYVQKILKSHKFTNGGEYCGQLEKELSEFLNIPFLSLCENGTRALEVAIEAAGLAGKKVITTPFSYVATVSALLWKGCQVEFADIDEESLTIAASCLEKLIDNDTAGIMPVFVYGHPCDAAAIQDIAKNSLKHDIPVIYDAAQAFGTTLDERSLLDFGDYSVCSFHATKAFHTAEGGCIICHSENELHKIRLISAFGHRGDEHFCLGINAKMSDIHAALGLSLLKEYEKQKNLRKNICRIYDEMISEEKVQRPKILPFSGNNYDPGKFESNYCYYPLIFNSEKILLKAAERLAQDGIYPRRYFFPALNTLPYVSYKPCPVAESVSKRILCLPLYGSLPVETACQIADAVNFVLSRN